MNSLSETLFQQFHRCVNLIHRLHHRTGHSEGGMHHGQGNVLSLLKDNEGISQKALTDLLQIRRASLAELLDKLERNELITRRPNSTDGRTFNVFLTDEGREVANVQQKERADTTLLLFSALSPEEQEQLSSLFTKLISALEAPLGDTDYLDHRDHGDHHRGLRRHGGHHHGHHGGY